MVGIVVPMKKEAFHLLDSIQDSQEVSLHSRKVITGRIEDVACTIIISGCGKVKSASATQLLLSKYQCDNVIHFGVAGALNLKLQIGDIVLGKKIIEHDYYQKFGTHEKPPVVMSYETLSNKAIEFAEQTGRPLISGTIVSGNEDIVTGTRREELVGKFAGDSVDWESAACAQVCDVMEIPFVVLRTIVDYAHEGTHKEFPRNFELSALNLCQFIYDFVAAKLK